MTSTPLITRRSAFGYPLALAAAGSLPASLPAAPAATAGDFSFLTGSWTVKHHMLKSRLTGERDWWDFTGTTRAWPVMEGQGNIDDNVLNHPHGAYRAVTLRHYDAGTRQWSIWWLDERTTRLDPPVVGRFENGEGRFFGDDTLRGMPIRVRFLWSDITARSARWEQAFSSDAGGSWEVNWVMQFTRQS
jgi:hypothetical protein